MLFEWFYNFVQIFLHLDQHLAELIQWAGPMTYVVLFLIIFAETGLVITPFLPGDSLLFAVGALTVIEGGLDLSTVLISLVVAGIIGDAVNYFIGHRLGIKIFEKNFIFLNQKNLEATQKFYQRWGGFTIVAARFAPIIRTFAPFLAGTGKMGYKKFLVWNVIGAVLWVNIFVLAGHYFGQVPAVKRNFQYIIIGIILVSLLPMVYQHVVSRKEAESNKKMLSM